MDGGGGRSFHGVGGDQSGSKNTQGNATSPFSVGNPLASIMSMMQGSPPVGPSDENKGQSKAPAKITMNIPSFFPKITTGSTSTGLKKPQEESTKIQQPKMSKNLPGVYSGVSSASAAAVPIPKVSPVRTPSGSSAPVTTFNNNPMSFQGQLASELVSVVHKPPAGSFVPPVRQQRPVPVVGVGGGVATSMTSSPSGPVKIIRSSPPGQRNVAAAIRGPTPPNKVSVIPPVEHKAPSVRDQQQPRKNPAVQVEEDPLSFCGDPLAADVEEAEMEDPLNPQKCDVPGCSHVKSPVISLFSIPQHGLASWCQILKINLTRMNSLDVGNLRICSEHFDLSQFVEGSACKELKPTAVPRPSAFSISAMTTVQAQAKRKEPQINFIPLPVPLPVAETSVPQSSDVTIHRVPAPVNPEGVHQLQQQRPVQPFSQQTVPVRPNAPSTAVSIQSVPSQRHPPPPKVQIMTVPAPAPAARPPGLLLGGSLNSTNASSLTAIITQQVGMRKPGPARGRPRKTPVNVTATYTTRPPQPPQPPPPSASILTTSKTSNVEPLPPPVPPQKVKVSVGSYSRPTIKLKSENVKIDEVANLVMPTEDWSVNVYPSFNKESKNLIFTISETVLNADMVEVVRKSITVHSNWAMKFSILSKDMSHFNLGLAVSDISDFQAVLDKFSSLPCCRGLSECLNSKNYTSLSLQMKVVVERFVDNVFRSVSCPLLIVNLEQGKSELFKGETTVICKPCRNMLQNLAFLKS